MTKECCKDCCVAQEQSILYDEVDCYKTCKEWQEEPTEQEYVCVYCGEPMDENVAVVFAPPGECSHMAIPKDWAKKSLLLTDEEIYQTKTPITEKFSCLLQEGKAVTGYNLELGRAIAQAQLDKVLGNTAQILDLIYGEE